MTWCFLRAAVGCAAFSLLLGCDDMVSSGVTAYEPERSAFEVGNMYSPPMYY